jgi:nucleotide-binding universal stress UspA family protein
VTAASCAYDAGVASVRRQLVWWRQDRALERQRENAGEAAEAMIHPVISGAAGDVRLADLGEVHHSIGVVLLATDGSEPAVCAMRYAVLFAKLFDAKLKAVYVDTGLEDIDLPEESCLDEALQGFDPCVQGLIAALKLSRINDVTCTIEVHKGGVVSHIVDAAKDSGAGLIVLGDTGRTGLPRVALGSIATGVIKASPVPVMVVKER